MASATLHYIYDPLCGWCYGAAPLIKAARAVVPVRAHAGGMMAGPGRQRVTPELRAYVLPHDQRIGQLTGQPFGEAYRDGLLRDTTAVFDSAPPIAAVLAAEQLAGRGLDMLARLQTAHYAEGRRIADRAVLVEMAGTLGMGMDAFAQAFDELEGAPVEQHIAATRQLMARIGVRGFPGFVLERDGQLERFDAAPYYGRPQALQEWLGSVLPARLETAAGADAAPGCGPDQCVI